MSSITFDLPQELETELKTKATQIGLSLSEYILHLLSIKPTSAENTLPQTGAELVAYWQQEGLCGYRSDISNRQTHARAIRNKAEKRIRHA